MTSTYEMQISEPWDFLHPNGLNIFKVVGVGVVSGPDQPDYGKEFFLVNVAIPFELDGVKVDQLICSPRYTGDTMQLLTNEGCTVGIARVKPHCNLSCDSTVNPNEVVYCAIGSIKPA